MRQPRRSPIAAQAKRLEQLAAAVDAYRDGHPRRRLSRGFRAAVVAAVEAGAPVRAVREACKVTASQISRWRQSAADGRQRRWIRVEHCRVREPAGVVGGGVVDAAPREDALLDSEIELRIGGWHVSLRRIAQ